MEILKSKKGNIPLLFVIICLIAVSIVAGLTDIASKSWALNEIQSILDVSGTNSLNKTINTKILREEIFGFDGEDYFDTETNKGNVKKYSKLIKTELNKQIQNHIKTNPNGYVKSFILDTASVEFSFADKWGMGETDKKRPQIILDTISKVRIKTGSNFDVIDNLTKNIYSARNGENFIVTYNGRKEDGTIELIIRSVTRLVYR